MPDIHDSIILLSKQSGITSFSSLWQIKNALGTKKIGHTGTLDTFAEGLLVALSGRLTRLVSFVTDCDKEYIAHISFGRETDTLDPDGIVIQEGPLPVLQSIRQALPLFSGKIHQYPPLYSAIHVEGKRASDRIRNGESITLPSREIEIFETEIIYALSRAGLPAQDSDEVSSIFLRVICSKGTYIRSLARDLAKSCGTCAHLAALRRTRIGPFKLEMAAGYSLLEPFGTMPPAKYGVGDRPLQADSEEIRCKSLVFSSALAPTLGFTAMHINADFRLDFLNGKTPRTDWFASLPQEIQTGVFFAVFCMEEFLGVLSLKHGQFRYEFVTGRIL